MALMSLQWPAAPLQRVMGRQRSLQQRLLLSLQTSQTLQTSQPLQSAILQRHRQPRQIIRQQQ